MDILFAEYILAILCICYNGRCLGRCSTFYIFRLVFTICVNENLLLVYWASSNPHIYFKLRDFLFHQPLHSLQLSLNSCPPNGRLTQFSKIPTQITSKLFTTIPRRPDRLTYNSQPITYNKFKRWLHSPEWSFFVLLFCFFT